MGISIVIGLTLLLVLVIIAVNAIQQNHARVEAEKKAEVAKYKALIDETEDVLGAAAYLPISNRLKVILQNRLIFCLRQCQELEPDVSAHKQRIEELQKLNGEINMDEGIPNDTRIQLPENEKQIIAIIQGIKKLRSLLRAEHSKARIDAKIHAHEDAVLTRYQLMVNVETLAKRASSSVQAKMLGSARQYIEKAVAALASRSNPDEYVVQRKQELEESLKNVMRMMRSNAEASSAQQAKQGNDDLDTLFAPKKKW